MAPTFPRIGASGHAGAIHARRIQTALDVLTDALRAGWRARDTSERNIHADQLALIV